MEIFHHIVGTDAETLTWWQMSVRAVIIMVYALVLLRVAARRVGGNDTVLDIVVAVIVGSALSRALTGNAPLLPTLVATALLVLLHAAAAALAVRSDLFSRLAKGRAVRLIRDGAVDWDRARHVLIGPHDLDQELRLRGVASPDEVQAAYLERNGRISVVRRPRKPAG